MYHEQKRTINHDTSTKDKPLSIVKCLVIVNQSYATKVWDYTIRLMYTGSTCYFSNFHNASDIDTTCQISYTNRLFINEFHFN